MTSQTKPIDLLVASGGMAGIFVGQGSSHSDLPVATVEPSNILS